MTDSTFMTPEEAAPADATIVEVEATDTPEAAPVADASTEVDTAPTPQAAPPDMSDEASEDDEDDDSAEDEDSDDPEDDDTDDDESDDEPGGEEDSEDADDDEDDDESEDVKSGDDAADEEDRPASRLEVEGDIAADYLEELLDIADLDGDIDTYVEGGRAQVSIVTEGDQLVGKNGEVLDALQELARLVVMTETDHRSRLMLDIAGHRDRRRSELTIVAKDAIAEVKQTGEAARLAPMNPFERKIIHDIVAEAGLSSESEGVEPKRRVVILP